MQQRDIQRRRWLVYASSAVASAPAAARLQSVAPAPRPGALMIIGGAEDREGDQLVLKRFVSLCCRPAPRVVVMPSASAYPEAAARRYDAVLAALGVGQRVVVHPASREQAHAVELVAQVATADGILITGGDQRRLTAVVGGTPLEQAIHQAFMNGACIAGTSAGAAVMSARMLWARSMGEGFGLLPQVIVDQHFTERRRLPRLLRALSRYPDHIGVGVDEDTALVLRRGHGAEVVGSGSVTIVDARSVQGPIAEMEPDALMHVPGLRVLRLAAQGPVDPGVARLLG